MNEYYSNLMFVNTESATGETALYFQTQRKNLFCTKRKAEFIKENEGKFTFDVCRIVCLGCRVLHKRWLSDKDRSL